MDQTGRDVKHLEERFEALLKQLHKNKIIYSEDLADLGEWHLYEELESTFKDDE